MATRDRLSEALYRYGANLASVADIVPPSPNPPELPDEDDEPVTGDESLHGAS